MTFVASLVLNIFISGVTSVEILVERRKDYDQILWDGDCSKINGSYATFNGTKMCACRVSGLYGTIFPNDDGFMGTVKQVSYATKIHRNREIDKNLLYYYLYRTVAISTLKLLHVLLEFKFIIWPNWHNIFTCISETLYAPLPN